MCSAACSVQRPVAGFWAGAENDDDAKRIHYASKSRKLWRRSKIWASPSYSRGLYCCSDIVAVVSGRVVLVACPLESKQRGGRCNKRLKPIEFFCGCCSQISRSHCLFIAIRRFARAGIQHVENALTMSVTQGCICSDHQSKQTSSRNAQLAWVDFRLSATRSYVPCYGRLKPRN
jgi:hypothetical protein